MLWNASAINGYAIAASDGQLGTVSDFLFDDASWLVRWLVVDTGNWLSGRKVLLPPSVLGQLDAKEHEFSVKLTIQQVKDSPDIDTQRPVSRQMETSIYDYYGWSPYWGTGFYMGGYGYMPGAGMASPHLGSRQRDEEIAATQRRDDDVHLRSIAAVTGYHIRASNGEIGHVEDFLVEDADWSIHFLVVDTSNWWFGMKVLISPQLARKIDWADRLVNLDVDRQKVKDSPPYDASKTVDWAYENHYRKYYGDIRPSDRP
jgi:hypothetical protein